MIEAVNMPLTWSVYILCCHYVKHIDKLKGFKSE